MAKEISLTTLNNFKEIAQFRQVIDKKKNQGGITLEPSEMPLMESLEFEIFKHF